MQDRSQIARVVVPDSDLEFTSPEGFNRMAVVETPFGPRQILVHKKVAARRAAKMLPLFIPHRGQLATGSGRNQGQLDDLLEVVKNTGIDRFDTFLLAAHRPASMIEYPDDVSIRCNYQLELPGGVGSGKDAVGSETALREAVEELGVPRENMVMHAPLVDWPAYNDAGSNAEVYQAYVCIVEGTPNPPRKEGIYPEHCWKGKVRMALKHLQHQAYEGVPMEWLAWGMLSQFLLMYAVDGTAGLFLLK